MKRKIACNLASYGPHREGAFEHLASIGLTNVEIPCPELGDVEEVRQKLADHGLTATSMILPCQMDADDVVLRFSHALETVSAMEVGIVFTSVKSGELDLDYVYGRLQNIGDAAAEHGVIVVLETHPDLVTNSQVAIETMAGVAHPNVRVNFDTANLYYYNEGIDAVEELARIAPYVGAVHLKDTNGGYRTWHFPALGRGVVDFGALFELLDAVEFSGPMALELEGVEGEALSEQDARSWVEESLEFLERLDVDWRT